MRTKRITAALATAVAALGLATGTATSAHAADSHGCNSYTQELSYIPTGGCLAPSDDQFHVGGIFFREDMPSNVVTNGSDSFLILQSDGNLVEYHYVYGGNDMFDGVWYRIDRVEMATNRFAKPGWLAMQYDGNLVAYDADGRPYWASNTKGWFDNTVTLRLEKGGLLHMTDSRYDVALGW
ncbi:hypothetical protein [Catenulispora subtropica]|uniref:Bulb-type lectin domain-containing protein n=1 Tax=Catenulispora subtropica TaxID=450798 RepID=A0ABP5EGI9_9ACTN